MGDRRREGGGSGGKGASVGSREGDGDGIGVGPREGGGDGVGVGP